VVNHSARSDACGSWHGGSLTSSRSGRQLLSCVPLFCP
jgi:hypothetical protein